MLRDGGFDHVRTLLDPTLAVSVVTNQRPDVIVLALHMAGRDGFEVMCDLAHECDSVMPAPVIVVTRDRSRETMRRALNYGAVDFVIRPLDQTELVLRVRNHLRLREMALLLDHRLHDTEADLERERLEGVERLVRAAEARYPSMGEHLRRIELLTSVIGARMGWSLEESQRLGRAARVHDLGKIAIADSILLKAAPLDETEQQVMRTHTTIGADLLSGGRSPLFQIAEQIARHHHERWDGGGYPAGLAGPAIPLAARIVAVADAFDAMTTDRPYRAAGTLRDAIQTIRAGAGTQFDPDVVKAFPEIDHRGQLDVGSALASLADATYGHADLVTQAA